MPLTHRESFPDLRETKIAFLEDYQIIKVGRFFPMVISSDFRMGEHRDDDHEEDTPYFKMRRYDWL